MVVVAVQGAPTDTANYSNSANWASGNRLTANSLTVLLRTNTRTGTVVTGTVVSVSGYSLRYTSLFTSKLPLNAAQIVPESYIVVSIEAPLSILFYCKVMQESYVNATNFSLCSPLGAL